MKDIYKWAGTSFLMISAMQVSFVVDWATQWWAYVGFLLGHFIWAVAAASMREWALLALNAAFIFIDTYAIIIRL